MCERLTFSYHILRPENHLDNGHFPLYICSMVHCRVWTLGNGPLHNATHVKTLEVSLYGSPLKLLQCFLQSCSVFGHFQMHIDLRLEILHTMHGVEVFNAAICSGVAAICSGVAAMRSGVAAICSGVAAMRSGVAAICKEL